FKNHVYHVTKEATFRFEKYYLLSTEKSSSKGIIGWMKESDVQTHNFVYVDDDKEVLKLSGEGSCYTHPWGGKKQFVYKNLKNKKNDSIKVLTTWMIGKN